MSVMPPAHAHAASRVARPGVLRLATHNVRGLRAHLHSLAQVWVGLHLDVVLVQETKLPFAEVVSTVTALNATVQHLAPAHSGFHALWALNQQASRSGGVMILLRRALVTSGLLVVDENHVRRDPGGRVVSVQVKWGGHAFWLTSAYLPNDSVGQQQWLQQHLAPLLQLGASHVLGGDFNFVPDPVVDRVSSAPGGGAAHSHVPVQLLAQLAPDLLDLFRQLHPARKGFTHHSATSAARLDRLYASFDVAAYCQQCVVGLDTPSDHRPVVMQLAMAAGQRQGPGLRRARLQHFVGDPAAWAAFQAYVEQQAAHAPQEQAALLVWWPGFKARLLAECLRLARQVRQEQQHVVQVTRTQAVQGLQAAYGVVEQAVTAAEVSQALQQVQVARQAWCQAVVGQQQLAEFQRRRQWVHVQERPSPAFTAVLGNTAARRNTHVPPLHSPVTGSLVQDGVPLAQVVASYWARVSAEPVVDQAAIDTVLQAVQSMGMTLPEAEADLIGATVVSELEVRAALKKAPSGKAPGLDGLPVEVWRKCGGVLVPLLARVFSAIGQLGVVPIGFHDGAITVHYKSGPRVDAANYRPITLLNTDYRLLAKVLASRLTVVQGQLISREQTAFLPGRHIGENIMLLQLLPHALPTTSEAVAVFLDFQKAYDTVSRRFLFAVLRAAGLGEGMLSWIELLLTDTQSCAVVNGFQSRRVLFAAGVRQGCPLAPQLYLFVGQAMLALLRAHGFGVTVGGRLVLATQFADDAQVFLESLQRLPSFLATMLLFKRASGQGLHMDKSEVLLIGRGVRRRLWYEHHSRLLQEQHEQQQRGQQQVAQQQVAQQQVVQQQLGQQRVAQQQGAQQQVGPQQVGQQLGQQHVAQQQVGQEQVAQQQGAQQQVGQQQVGQQLGQQHVTQQQVGQEQVAQQQVGQQQVAQHQVAQRQVAQQPVGQQQVTQQQVVLLPGHARVGRVKVPVLKVPRAGRRGQTATQVAACLQQQLRRHVQQHQQQQRALALLQARAARSPALHHLVGWRQQQLQQQWHRMALEAVGSQLQHDPSAVPPGASHSGLRLVGSAKALGVVHLASGQSATDWDALWQTVKGKLTSIASLPLSMFGRAFASSGYGLSKLLYTAEFVGEPPQRVLAAMLDAIAKVVDRGQAPDDSRRAFAGVAADLLLGHPRDGGCGVLPLLQHIRARHAQWGIKLMLGCGDTPWVHVARCLLLPPHVTTASAPMWSALGVCMGNVTNGTGPAGGRLPPPLQRLLRGVRALPDWSDSGPVLQLGPWCADAPLWCNPWLRPPGAQGGGIGVRGLEQEFGDLALLGTINTVRDALQASHDVAAARPVARYHDTAWVTWLRETPQFRDWQAAEERLQQLVQAIPVAWRQQAEGVLQLGIPAGPAAAAAVADVLLPRLRWVLPAGKVVHLEDASVAVCTALQMDSHRAILAARHAAFLQILQQYPPLQMPPTHLELQHLLHKLWKLGWDNQRKEFFWRFVLDALPTAARMHQQGSQCGCGGLVPGRLHHYWECPVAQAVVACVRQQLPGSPVLHPVHVWMARVPVQGMHGGVWRVAALAALLAMDTGRRLLCKWSLHEPPAPPPPPVGQRVQIAARVAVASFWDKLWDFVGLGLAPQAWLLRVGTEHPFLAVLVAPDNGDLSLRVRRV